MWCLPLSLLLWPVNEKNTCLIVGLKLIVKVNAKVAFQVRNEMYTFYFTWNILWRRDTFAHLRICTPLNRDLAIRHIFLKLFSSEGILEFSIKFPSIDIHNILHIDIDNICAYFFCYLQNAFHWSSAVPKRFKRNINEELHQAM